VASPEKSLFSHIEALIDDGEVTIGIIRPVGCVAVATDGHQALAMLRRRSGESLMDLLQRLDTAIKTAVEQEIYTDEINSPAPGSKRSR
jgi:hypothetical protein